MARKSMIVKSEREPKFKVENTLDVKFVEDLMQFLRNMEFAVFVLENLLTKVKYLV